MDWWANACLAAELVNWSGLAGRWCWIGVQLDAEGLEVSRSPIVHRFHTTLTGYPFNRCRRSTARLSRKTPQKNITKPSATGMK